MYCQSCHLYPEPSTLDKNTWERSVLPLMGRIFGIYEGNVSRREIINGAINPGLVREMNMFPEKELISDKIWRKIMYYYISSAPKSLPSIERNDTLFASIEGFEIITPSFRKEPFTTTFKK